MSYALVAALTPVPAEALVVPSWDKVVATAVRLERPLLIFVRQRPRPVPGCVSTAVDSYPGQDGYPGVVIGLPDGQGGVVEATRRDSYPTAAWLAFRVRELQAQARRLKNQEFQACW
jgi:hypothetical protein